jgi:hypothetical protein
VSHPLQRPMATEVPSLVATADDKCRSVFSLDQARPVLADLDPHWGVPGRWRSGSSGIPTIRTRQRSHPAGHEPRRPDRVLLTCRTR